MGAKYFDHGNIILSYTEIDHCGDAASPCFGYSAFGARDINFSHVTCDACGVLIRDTYSIGTPASFILDNVDTHNGVGLVNGGSYALYVTLSANSSIPTGTRRIASCDFDRQVKLPQNRLTISDTFFNNTFEFASGLTNAKAWASFDGNLVRALPPLNVNTAGNVTNSYLLWDSQTVGNPHFLSPDGSLSSITYSGNVFEYTGPNNATLGADMGDAMLHFDGAGLTITIDHNLVLPNTPGTDSSGTLFTFFQGNSSLGATLVHHNTYTMGNVISGANFNEPNSGTNMATGQVTFRDNLAWNYAGASAALKVADVKNFANPATAPGNFLALGDYNSGCKLRASTTAAPGDSAAGYWLKSSVQLGAHDVDFANCTGAGSPGLVDPARNFSKWAKSMGSTGTDTQARADALSKLLYRNSRVKAIAAEYADISFASILSYVKAGFAPTSPLLHNADSTGAGDIGAVAWVAPAATGGYTSSQAGAWNSPATWGGTGVPGIGDVVTVAHTVTCPAGVVCNIGNYTPGVDSLTLTPTAALIINGTLHIEGDLNHQGTLTVGPDSVLEFGSSGYTWKSYTNSGVPNLLQSSGTSAEHSFTIRTVAGGTNANIAVNLQSANQVAMAYGTFLRMGAANGKAYHLNYGGGSTGDVVNWLDHVTFDTSGQLWLDNAPASSGWRITNCKFINSLAANPLLLNGSASLVATRLLDGTIFDKPPLIQGNGAIYTRNVFLAGFMRQASTTDWAQFGEAIPGDGFGNFIRVTGATGNGAQVAGGLTGNYILADSPSAPMAAGSVSIAANATNTGTLTDYAAAWAVSSGPGTGFAANTSNNAWMAAITGGTGAGQIRSILSNTANTLTLLYPWTIVPDTTSKYAIVKGLANPRVLTNIVVGPKVTHSHNVAEHTGADNTGELFSALTVAGVTFDIDYNLAIPSGSGDHSFDLIASGATTSGFSMQHNTVWAGGRSAATINHGSNVPSGAMSYYKSNLVVSDPAKTGLWAVTGTGLWTASPLGPYQLGDGLNAGDPAGGNPDIVSPLNATNNGGWGLKPGYATNGYNVNLSGTPDAGSGVSANPQFIDPARNFGTWAYARGYSASVSPLQRVTDGLAALQADPARIADLIAYVRNGFAPQNALFHNMAHDGGDIGAVPWARPLGLRGPRHRVIE